MTLSRAASPSSASYATSGPLAGAREPSRPSEVVLYTLVSGPLRAPPGRGWWGGRDTERRCENSGRISGQSAFCLPLPPHTFV